MEHQFLEPLTPTYDEFKNFAKYVNDLYRRGYWKYGVTLVSEKFFSLYDN